MLSAFSVRVPFMHGMPMRTHEHLETNFNRSNKRCSMIESDQNDIVLRHDQRIELLI